MNATEFQQRIVVMHASLFRAAVAILGNRDDAADAVQDTMVKLWQNASALDSLTNVQAYAFATLRNQALDVQRRRSAHHAVDLNAVSDPPPDEPLPSSDLEMVAQIVEELPDNYRQVTRMSVYQNLSTAEIASATGLSNDNVRQILSRSRQKIKQLYQKLKQ